MNSPRPLFKEGTFAANIEFNGREVIRYVDEVITHEIEEQPVHNTTTLYHGHGYYYRVSEDRKLGWVSSEFSKFRSICCEIPEYLRGNPDEILKFLSEVTGKLDQEIA
jgi:hypothetical protein